MKSLAFAFIFACYFFACASLDQPLGVPNTCEVTAIENQMRAVLEEGCTTLECVNDIIHQRALIAAEYIKVCK